MINNLELIKPLLSFESEDEFYFIQILKRKKEHEELGSNSYMVKSYYIKSIEHLEKVMGEIISICDYHKARAYINLSPRSFEKIAFHLMKKISDIMMNKDFKSCRNAYDSACGTYGNGRSKKWVIDIDWVDFENTDTITKLVDKHSEITNLISELVRETGIEPKLVIVPSLNGYSIISDPFNVQKFSQQFPKTDIHKNNSCNLYIG